MTVTTGGPTVIDTILHVSDFDTLVTYLDDYHPQLLERTESGTIVQPPRVAGFSRTPAAIGDDGNSLMIYARLRPDEVENWRGMPHVTVLAEAEYVGEGTAETVYAQVFDDPDKTATYDSVYDRSPREVPDGEGSTITYTPRDWFGILTGA